MRSKLYVVLMWLALVVGVCIAGERAAAKFGGFSCLGWIAGRWQSLSEQSIGIAPLDDFENDPRFHELLLTIASEYPTYGRLDERIRFAPTACAGGTPRPRASEAAFSRSDATDTHGRKLYFLFVNLQHQYAYGNFGDDPKQPVGQVIVKESWQAAPVVGAQNPTVVGRPDDPQSYVPFARDPSSGQLYHTGDPRGLFIMAKLDPATPGTDEGWVYGTVTSDGKQVTSSGNVTNCAHCHQDARADRMLGLPSHTGP